MESLATGTTSWSLAGPALSTLRGLPAGFYGVRATAVDNAANLKRSVWKRFAITSTTRQEVGGDVSQPAPTSAVRLSSAQASVSSIVLRFTGALDSGDATDAASFVVWVNGQVVEVESVAYSNSIVRLGLPEGAVQAGDVVQVTWHDLHDSGGHVLATPDLNLNVR